MQALSHSLRLQSLVKLGNRLFQPFDPLRRGVNVTNIPSSYTPSPLLPHYPTMHWLTVSVSVWSLVCVLTVVYTTSLVLVE